MRASSRGAKGASVAAAFGPDVELPEPSPNPAGPDSHVALRPSALPTCAPPYLDLVDADGDEGWATHARTGCFLRIAEAAAPAGSAYAQRPPAPAPRSGVRFSESEPDPDDLETIWARAFGDWLHDTDWTGVASEIREADHDLPSPLLRCDHGWMADEYCTQGLCTWRAGRAGERAKR